MGRKKKSFERPIEKRDSSLVIIATEGRVTEKNYFEALKESFYNSKVHVEIIPNEQNESDPTKTFDRLKDFEKKYQIGNGDSLFLVIDIDKWGDKKISKVATLCKQSNFTLCVSNPCFELWLLLHEKDVTKCSKTEKEKLLKNKRISVKKLYLDSILSEIWAGYRKKIDFSSRQK